ncbi:MAG: hypothetical protein KBF92_09525 [Bacteroidia bacterium]|jgi:hypothetical protein|nr:hypothetical protein [Bacteroidota bacterium]MBK8585245.1 hypothetical protein [Bacteroidota bacterium]MBP9790555.1 hypothetical protein [Bacteroidia bacterium]MBP9924059.1 hypothetical protein [Bacteroidia bacterium]HQW00534.1 hypothetical protein [Bacteroidia bacterium]
MEAFLKILTLILISSVKFAFGPSFAYLNEQYDFTWLETNIYAIMGGMMGVTIFMHVSDWLISMWDKVREMIFKRKRRRNSMFSPPVADTPELLEIHYNYVESMVPEKKIFTPRTRKIVKIWRKYGLIGLAALTPIMLSIPVGTFFMTRLEKNKKKIIFYMFVSITSWSLLITTIFQLAHVRTLHEILQ